MKAELMDEIVKALGLGKSHLSHRLLEPFFGPAVQRFAEVAARFDNDVATYGLRQAASRLLPHFTREIRVQGEENVPGEGPLLVVSNHPGTVDVVVIAAGLPRPDLKIVASGGIPFFRSLKATTDHLIFSGIDAIGKMNVIRSSIRHLQEGGAVLIFPNGGIDPDPSVMPGAPEAVETWSRSLDLMLRRVPNAQVLITAVSGVLAPRWMHSPLTWLHKGRRNRQKVAEVLQMVQQMLFPSSPLISPTVSFAQPLRLVPQDKEPLLPAIIASAKAYYSHL
jgi:hypothetical protein